MWKGCATASGPNTRSVPLYRCNKTGSPLSSRTCVVLRRDSKVQSQTLKRRAAARGATQLPSYFFTTLSNSYSLLPLSALASRRAAGLRARRIIQLGMPRVASTCLPLSRSLPECSVCARSGEVGSDPNFAECPILTTKTHVHFVVTPQNSTVFRLAKGCLPKSALDIFLIAH